MVVQQTGVLQRPEDEDPTAASSVQRPPRPGRVAEAAALARTHWLMLVLVLVGAALRAVVMYAYAPALMFFGDSYGYLVSAQSGVANSQHPFGYSALLRLLSWTGQLASVTLVQHLAGLGIAVVVYVVLLRRGLPPWVAALLSAPLLLDGFVVDLEQQVMSETLFSVLMVGGTVLLMRKPLTWLPAAAGGLCLAAAALTRTAAVPLLVVVAVYLLVRKVGWRPLVAAGVVVVVTLGAYQAWVPARAGSAWSTSDAGKFLYARVAPFADCARVDLSAVERTLCPTGQASSRPNANFYAWSAKSPYHLFLATPTDPRGAVAQAFAEKVILAQPAAYARQVGDDLAHYFAPGHTIGRLDAPLTPWVFPKAVSAAADAESVDIAQTTFSGTYVPARVHRSAARALRAYQRVVYTPGPLLLLLLLVGVAGALFGRGRRDRTDAMFTAVVGVSVLVVPAATAIFDYRYGIAAIPFACLTAGLGLRALGRRRGWLGRGGDDPDAERQPVPDAGQSAVRRARLARTVGVLGVVGVAVVAALVVTAPLHANPIFTVYEGHRADLGALGPGIGAAFTPEGRPGTTVQLYRHGMITSTDGGTFAVGGAATRAIAGNGGLTRFGAAVGPGAPWSAHLGFQRFEDGVVFVPDKGAPVVVVGPVYRFWSEPAITARLGAPLADAVPIGPGAELQAFTGGTVVLHGATTTVLYGPVRSVAVRPSGGPRLLDL